MSKVLNEGDLTLAKERDYPDDPESGFKYGNLKELAEKYGKDYQSLCTCQWVARTYKPVTPGLQV